MSAEAVPDVTDVAAADDAAVVDDVLSEVHAELSRTLDGLRAALRSAAGQDGPLRPGALHVDLVAELGRRLAGPGKRVRPRLAHRGWLLAGGEDATRPGLLRVAAALELLHLFGLVQDDVMDRSDTRRGTPTVHVEASRRHTAHDGLGDPVLFGDSVAVLLGDLALAEAAALVAGCPPEVRHVWRVMTAELVEGQLLDVTHTADRRRDLATSRRIARFKSGRYTITRPLQLGALVAGADAALVDRLGTWGDLVGDAFALRDDVLGVWGDPEVTGKPAGDDLRSGKPTVLLVWAAEALPDADRHLLDACDAGGLDPAGTLALQHAMERAGVRQRAEDEIRRLTTRADRIVPRLTTDPDAAQALREVVRSVAWRSS
ncbi:polyprenyl synthetase family protein [Phycicoccus flavus]|uniref:Polyprenyl synthetase family protein n=1 Tax=Phycicoccus flavus TaxID=2502783 RepID=A0A8T6R2X5_9MICO|nr:polyprenyl synthetase family protein [Phycicoccus flavus]NHA68132.1 polyprenyl synthetase family protein [Phycicoccus flavus]